jgi:hypothetical protein
VLIDKDALLPYASVHQPGSIIDWCNAHQDIKPRFHQSRMVGGADGAEGDEV